VLLILAILSVGAFGVYRATSVEERQRFLEEKVQPAAAAIDHVFFATEPFRELVTARTRRLIATPVIGGLTLVFFAYMTFGHGDANEHARLIAWGASYGPRTTNGEWWRLLTATFLQPGPFHLLFTLIGFAQLSELLERLVGPYVVAGVYLVAGTLGTLSNLSQNPLGVHAGGAPAVCGLYGLLFAVIAWTWIRKGAIRIPIAVLKTLAPAAAIFFLYTLLSFELSGRANGIGLMTGVIAGAALGMDVANRLPSWRPVAIAAAAALALIVYQAVPLGGIVDIRPDLAEILFREDRAADMYRAAVSRYTRNQKPVDTGALIDLIDRTILPELGESRARVAGLTTPLAAHQPLVAGALQFLSLRETSWKLRAEALRKRNMSTLRDAERVERESFDALEKLRRSFVV